MICDYGCGKEARYQFKNGKRCCSENFRSCSQNKEKMKRIFIEKYGVDHNFKIAEVQEKRKQTFINKYGVAHNFKIAEVQEKRKQTFMTKYGVINPSQSKEVQEKMKRTNIEKYGVEHPLQNKEIQEKMKRTNIEKYGVENPFQNKEVQEKRKQTNIEKYGVGVPSKNKEVQEKMKQSCLEKYGSTNYKQSLEAKESLLEKHPFFCQVEEIKIENNEFKVHCKNHNCINSKEKGGWFTPTSSQINNRITALEGKTGNDGSYFYCSQECKYNCPLFNMYSDPNRDNQFLFTREEYETFRLQVLTRDNYICQFCGEPATHVHHERPVKLEPFHVVDPDFGWACCEKCHYEKGHPQGTECSTGNLAAKVCGPIIKKKENFI